MKLLHTADWHLGKRLETIPRIEEQRIVFEEICTIADEQNVDAIVIAGDLYDAFNPPTEAIELFYSILKKLSHKGTRPVIAIAGNHDSPDRIEAPNPLARDNGIILIGNPKTTYPIATNDLPFQITKSDESFIELTFANKESLRIILAPFANEHRLEEAFMSNNKDKELVAFLTQYWQEIAEKYCNTKGVNIFIGHHLFLPHFSAKIEEPDDERPIQAISALLPFSSIPKQIQYVALGHLHRNQIIHSNPPIVYSGSPVAYSFSEAMQKKYVSIVEIEKGKQAEVHQIELQTPMPLIRKKFNSCDDANNWLLEHQNCYVELTICSDTYLNPAQIKSFYNAHNKIVTIIPEVVITNEISERVSVDSYDKTIEELFEEYFISKKNGQKPNEELKVLFQRILAAEN